MLYHPYIKLTEKMSITAFAQFSKAPMTGMVDGEIEQNVSLIMFNDILLFLSWLN